MELPDCGEGIAVTLVRNGYIPTSPEKPSTAIEIQLLKVYQEVNGRCPNLGIQAFVRATCDLNYVRKIPLSPDLHFQLIKT